MWSQINDEISSIKRQASKNIPTVQEIVTGTQNLLFNRGPGLLVDIHHQAKSIYPKNFTGLNLIANKILNHQTDYNFNVNLNTEDFVYSPYKSYIGREEKRYASECNQAGYSSITFRQDISDELKLTVCGHIQHVKSGTVECVMDYYGKGFTTSASIANINTSLVEIIIQHLQEINRKIAVGLELNLKGQSNFSPSSQNVSAVGRYYEDSIKGIISGTVGSQGMQMCIAKEIKPQLSVATILDVCFQKRHITGSIACKYIEKDMSLQASIDNTGCVVINLSKKDLYKNDKIVFRPTISVLLNLQKTFKLGIGFELFI